MIALDPSFDYLTPAEMEANFDAPDFPERAEWELTLSAMKQAILEQKFLKAKHLMYRLEAQIIKSNIERFSEGFRQGSEPLPF